jgi:class 3 adenylate cyclase
VTSAPEQPAVSAEDRLSLLIDRLLTSMDVAATTGSWDRVVELANDVLMVDPPNQRAASMIDRAALERSLPQGQRAERAFVSLIFADIVQSTDMADVAEPEVVQEVFAVYRRVATETVEELGGRILQFQGDGVVACFGYPLAHGDDARRAVLAGLRLVERMAGAANDLRGRHGIDPAIRVGVHSGTVVFAKRADGNIDGSAIMGSAPNVTARLQGEAESGTVVISDTTNQLVEPHFELASMGTRSLKGISRPMELYRVVRSNLSVPGATHGLPERVVLVDREGERHLLRSTWARVVHALEATALGEGTTVLIRGAPGIGKSALAAELVDHVRLQGSDVLDANCSPYHGNVALWPVARMLEQLLNFYPGQPAGDRVAQLAASLDDVGLGTDALPLVAPLLGLDTHEHWTRPEVDALALRQETLQTLVAWLAHAAASTPTLVLVEDLHWADPTTVDLLGLLATERVPGTMILLTSRFPMDTLWESYVLDIALEPLNVQEAAGLVSTLTDGGLDETQRRLIVERGTGNPLFLRELTRSALTTSPGEVLPPRIHEILTARLRAPGIDLRVAQLAATLGAEFDTEPLRQLAERPLDNALIGLEHAGIIEPVGVRLGRFRFQHALLRDAAYETQVLPSRQESHRRVAELLGSSAISVGDLAVLAQHRDLAGDVPQAIATYIGAAQAAAQSAASHTEARRLLNRALELSATTPESEERDLTELMIRMQRTVSTSSLFGYGYPDVLEDFTVAEEICRRRTNRPEIMPAQVGIWSYLLVRGTVGAATTVLDPLTEVVDDPATAWFAPEIKSCMGYSAFYQGDLEDAHRCLQDAWDGYGARSDEGSTSPFWPLPHDPVPITAVALACVAALRGCTDESATWEQRALATAEGLDFPAGPFSSAFVSVYLAWVRMITGDLDQARAFGRRTLEIADRCRFDYFRLLGGQYLLLPEPGRPCDEAELAQCGAAMDLVGHAAFRPTYLGIVARNHLYLGNAEQALTQLDDALKQTRTSGELVHQPDLLRLRAEITGQARPEKMDEVVTDLVSAVDIGVDQGSVVLALRAANDLARLPDAHRPADWADRVRSVLDRFPPGSSSPELFDARTLLRD